MNLKSEPTGLAGVGREGEGMRLGGAGEDSQVGPEPSAEAGVTGVTVEALLGVGASAASQA